MLLFNVTHVLLLPHNDVVIALPGIYGGIQDGACLDKNVRINSSSWNLMLPGVTVFCKLNLTPLNFAASKTGKCKIYHQLLDICRDMMKTVKKMYGTYMYERYLFAKEKDRFTRKLKRVTKQLEVSGTII